MKRDRLKFIWSSSLDYFINSKTIYDLDAPFVFNLSKAIFDNKNDPPTFVEIEKRRRFLKKDQTPLERTDLGQGSLNRSLNSDRIKISTLVRSSSILPYHGRFLSRLVKYLKPTLILELGTSLGISGSYLKSGYSESQLITIEGDPSIAQVAEKTFIELKISNVLVVQGSFDAKLPGILETQHPDLTFIDGNHHSLALNQYIDRLYPCLKSGLSTIIVDDIRWSADMYRAWKVLARDPRWQISIDLNRMGLLIKNPDILHHQEYLIINHDLKPWRLGLLR